MAKTVGYTGDCAQCFSDMANCTGLTKFSKQTVLAIGDVHGRCTNDDDTKVWNSKGKAHFDLDLNGCAKKCLGAKGCVKECMMKAEGYTDNCAQCFGDVAECTKDHCLLKCMSGESPDCKSCVSANCEPALKTC